MNPMVLLSRLKRKLFRRPYLKDKRYPAFWFNKLLKGKKAFILQIGSNDGKTGDPLYPLLRKNKRWKALFVEPVPYLFERLKKNYPDRTRFSFENAAVNKGEKLKFYWIDPAIKKIFKDLPFWYEQLGSFDKQHIINELGKEVEPFILASEIHGITLESLLERNQVRQIDVLHIDAEGYDWVILSQLDLQRFEPKFILFEYKHLPEEARVNAFRFLNAKYAIYEVGIEMLSINRQSGAAIIKEIDENNYLKNKVAGH